MSTNYQKYKIGFIWYLLQKNHTTLSRWWWGCWDTGIWLLHLALAWDGRITDQDLIFISCPNLHFLLLFVAFQPCGFGIWPKTNWKLKPVKVQHFFLSSKKCWTKINTLPPAVSPLTYTHSKTSAPQETGMSNTESFVSYLKEDLAIAFPLVTHKNEIDGSVSP